MLKSPDTEYPLYNKNYPIIGRFSYVLRLIFILEVSSFCPISPIQCPISDSFSQEGINLLRMAMEKLSLSARAYNRILKVARTIADLAGSQQVEPQHLAEAIGYRTLDRGDWAERGHF